jgi:DNA-binding YbaB/EbfC family protein
VTTPEIPGNDDQIANPAGADADLASDADLAAVDADPMAALLGGLDLGSMMETVQEMQQQMAEAQNALAATEVEGSAGGGKVRVTITGDFLPVSVRLNPEVVDPDETEMLEDLILAAWRDAVAEVGRSHQAADPMAGLDLSSMGLDPSALGFGGGPESDALPDTADGEA